MGEIVTTARVMSFNMECPNCKRGMMIFVGMSVFTPDGKEMFLHACNFCGFQNTYEKKYPFNIPISECQEVYEQ